MGYFEKAGELASSQKMDANRVEAVIRSARRRRLATLAYEQLAIAFALVFGGAVLMLLLGTQILDWYWLVLLAGIGIAVAVVRTRKQLLPEYRLAQLLDRRLGLNDALSTAWYLRSDGMSRENPAARFQLRQADEVAASVDPASVFPFAGGRVWTIAGALAAVVFGLFAVRYLVTSSLNLRPSLIPIQFAAIFERPDKPGASETDNANVSRTAAQQQAATPQHGSEKQNQKDQEAVPFEQAKIGKPDGSSGGSNGDPNASEPDNNAPAKDGQSAAREDGQSNAKSAAADENGATKPESKPQEQAADTQEQRDATQQSSSRLMDKVKDAFSSMMAKMRPNSSSQTAGKNGQRSADDKNGGDQSAANKDQSGEPQPNGQSQASDRQSAEGKAQGQTAERTQAAQGQTSGQAADRNSKDAHSGVGRQDGEKTLREAEQLQAMGKLAEIIGKRSANLTGDVMVETPSGKQQLKTEYSQRLGHHADLGGEINRDDIPLEYQQYVRDYMVQVRKQGKNN